MSCFTPKSRHLLVAFLGLATAFGATPFVYAQDEPVAATDPAEDAEDAPIIPATPFPSVIALDPTDAVWTLKISNGRMRVKGDVAVNSVNRGALWMADGSLAIDEGTLNVAGNVSRLGKISIQPAPNLGARPVADPIPAFEVEAPEKVVSREKLFLQTQDGGDDTVLPPGIYNGGIFASGKGHITLQPGVFVISNGDFSAIGPAVEGKDVTIVMSGAKAGALSFSLGATLNAAAPKSGRYKDLLVVSRAKGTFARGVDFAVAQGRMDGIIYAPTASVSVQSKGSLLVRKIIAKNVDVTGGTLQVTGMGDDKAADDAAPAGDAGATAPGQ